MHHYRKKSTHAISVHTRIKHYLLCSGFFLLMPGIVLASVNQPATLATQQQTDIQSFHETTALAETLWANLTNRFIVYYEKGDYQNALLVAQRVYNIANNNFGLHDVNTADALLKLGIINQTLGNLGKAEERFLTALHILEEQLTPDHPDLTVIMTNLGNVYFELQRPGLSEKYHQQALQIRKNAFDADDPAIAQSTYNLAVLYEDQKKYERAAIFYQRAISLWSASMGPTHPYVGSALSNLSGIYNIQGKHQKATNILQRMLALKKSVFGAQHEEVAQTLVSLGTSYLEQGEYSPASDAYEEALDIAQHVLASSDPQLALLMYTLANIYHTQARIEEQKLYSQIPKTGTMPTSNSAILTDTAQRKTAFFAQALPLYKKAAEILDSGKNETQPALDIILTELAMLYKETGNPDMAQVIESRITTH